MCAKITIKDNREFRRVYARGKSYISPVLVAYVRKNHSGDIRIGVTAGKKVGNAVRRNRCKRVIRAAFNEVYPNVKNGFDIIFVARTKTFYIKSNLLAENMNDLLKKAGVIKE